MQVAPVREHLEQNDLMRAGLEGQLRDHWGSGAGARGGEGMGGGWPASGCLAAAA